jgi:hypothetical protein
MFLSRRPFRLPLAQLRPHQSRDPHRGVPATANKPAASDMASLARIKKDDDHSGGGQLTFNRS